MRLLTIATAAVLTFAFSQSVLAQSHDDGAVGRPLQLDGGSSLGSDNRGIGARSEATEPSVGARSEKSQTGIEKTGEAHIPGRCHTHIGRSFRAKHRFAIHRR